jgi:hypothetical protein
MTISIRGASIELRAGGIVHSNDPEGGVLSSTRSRGRREVLSRRPHRGAIGGQPPHQVRVLEEEADVDLGRVLDDEPVVEDVGKRPASSVLTCDVRDEPVA